MREELEEFEGKKLTFKGTCVDFGSRMVNGRKVIKTVLLKDLISSEVTIEHMWFDYDCFPKLTLNDTIEFTSRIKKFVKGYKGKDEILQKNKPQQIDYRLSLPKSIKVTKNVSKKSI
jgi:hypothetical protein